MLLATKPSHVGGNDRAFPEDTLKRQTMPIFREDCDLL